MDKKSKKFLEKDHIEHARLVAGRLTLSLKDGGAGTGVHLSISTDCCGFPGIDANIRVDNYGLEVLDAMQRFIYSARKDIEGINWESRYSNPENERDSTLEKIKTRIKNKINRSEPGLSWDTRQQLKFENFGMESALRIIEEVERG